MGSALAGVMGEMARGKDLTRRHEEEMSEEVGAHEGVVMDRWIGCVFRCGLLRGDDKA
jgi:hypothetical protein